MALKLTVDSLDGIEDAHKSLYAERDGKFHLDVDGIEDTGGLKSALSKERTARTQAEKDAARWKALGKTPEEIEELFSAQEKAAEEKATKAGEWDKLRAQMNDKHQIELKARGEQVGKMRGALDRYLVDAAATAAIAAAKGVPELLLPHVQRHVKVIEQDGEYFAQVVDAKGDPRVNAKGEALTIAELVAEMRGSEIFGRAFEGSGNSGSGKQPGASAGGAGVTRKSDFKSEKDRAAWVEKHGFDAYRALPDR